VKKRRKVASRENSNNGLVEEITLNKEWRQPPHKTQAKATRCWKGVVEAFMVVERLGVKKGRDTAVREIEWGVFGVVWREKNRKYT